MLLLIRAGKRLFHSTPVHRWSPVNRAYRGLFHAVYGSSGVQVVPYQGHTFEVPTRDITILPSLLNDDYESYEFELMVGVCRPGMVVADVGANIGLFAVTLGAVVGPEGHVHAFEPEPDNYAVLRRNLTRNGISNVTAEQLAAASDRGARTLHVEAGSIGTHTLVPGLRTGIEREVEVRTTDLDSYFRGHGRWPDVVKVDVEGYEPYVFRGAAETLARARFLFFEYSRDDLRWQGFRADDVVGPLATFPHLYRIDERARRVERCDVRDLAATAYANLVASKEPLSASWLY